jgi:hypothetical protein
MLILGNATLLCRRQWKTPLHAQHTCLTVPIHHPILSKTFTGANYDDIAARLPLCMHNNPA